MAWFECTGGSGGGGGSTTIPQLIGLVVGNRYTDASISYTFTEAGTFQYYAAAKAGEVAVGENDISIQLNGVEITPNTYNDQTVNPYLIKYGEVTVSANDVITVVRNVASQHSGYHLNILQNADISVFDFLGFVYNDGSTFNIVNDGIALEVYYQGYWYSARNCRSHLIAGNAVCIPSPSGSDYYYGGTYAIKVL